MMNRMLYLGIKNIPCMNKTKLLSMVSCSILSKSFQVQSELSFSTSWNSFLQDKMKQWQTDSFSGINELYLSSEDLPPLMSPTDVLVKVNAASINPIDVKVMGGYGQDLLQTMKKITELSLGKLECENPKTFPLTVGRDFSGEIVQIGNGVKNIVMGDKVWGIVSPMDQGSHAEYIVVDACNVCTKPSNLNDIEASSIPYVALTSWSALVLTGGLEPRNCYGSQILIIGASGGIGTFMTQLLATWGAEVTAVCSKKNFERVLSYGVKDAYDYSDSQTKLYLTTHPQYDLIIDCSGKEDISWTEGLREWNNSSYITLDSPLLKNIDEKGVLKGALKSFCQILQQNSLSLPKGKAVKWAYFMPNPYALAEVSKMVYNGEIKPYVSNVYSMTEAKEAYRQVENGKAEGKVVINILSATKTNRASN